jgi:hypothetical protein
MESPADWSILSLVAPGVSRQKLLSSKRKWGGSYELNGPATPGFESLLVDR